jgi:hypothetical protein
VPEQLADGVSRFLEAHGCAPAYFRPSVAALRDADASSITEVQLQLAIG